MKKINLKTFIACVLILATACSIGAASVSALTPEGSDLIDKITSAVGGIDGIGGIIDNFIPSKEETTTRSQADYAGAEEALGDILQKIGLSTDILAVTDLVSYLNRGGSFSDWIYDNYGNDVEIPDSVKNMPKGELVMFLMSAVLYPDSVTQNKESTTPGYVFIPDKDKTETTTKKVYTTVPVTENIGRYKTGDVNNDGNVNAIDARIALRVGAQLEKIEDAALDAADVNGDGRVTANDARSILRYAAKLTNGF